MKLVMRTTSKCIVTPPRLNLECLERDLPLQFSKLNCQERESAARSLNLSVPSLAGLPVLHTSAFVKFKFPAEIII